MNHRVLLTFDVDRDWPIEKYGRMEAISGMKDDTPDDPAIRATAQGLEFILDILEEKGKRATFFLEAAVLNKLQRDTVSRLSKHDIGCHGYAHEDFLGLGTGYTPTSEERTNVLRTAQAIISDRIRPPMGFRAPYLRWDRELLRLVSNLGFQYDSSETIKQATALQAYETNGLLEVPLSTGTDMENAIISGYLWQLHEGKRSVDDYLYFIRNQAENPRIEYSMLATHPWHLYLSTGKRSYLTGDELQRNLGAFRGLMDQIEDNIMAIDEYLTHLSEQNKP